MIHNILQLFVSAVRFWSGRHLIALTVLMMFSVSPLLAEPRVEDADQDGIPDTVDLDDDNDGIFDRQEITPQGSDRDTDRDGMPDRLDLDSDQDGILDLEESGIFRLSGISKVRVVGGRLRTAVGLNGVADILETATDSAIAVYEPLNSDAAEGDTLPDYLDLDSDNDGLVDLIEAGVPPSLDNNSDGRIDSGVGRVGADGIDDRYQINNDANCCDYTLDGVEDTTPRNTDNVDFPDFQDVDSDNDGVFDLVEAGGSDQNGDGRIDGFIDDPLNPDGLDDALALVPMTPPDGNQNGLPDYIDWEIQSRPDIAPDVTPNATVVALPADDPVQAGPEVVNLPASPESSQNEVVNGESLTVDAAPEVTVVADDPIVASASSGPLQTGLAGSGGCSVMDSDRFDPLFPFFLVIAFLWLMRGRACVWLSSR